MADSILPNDKLSNDTRNFTGDARLPPGKLQPMGFGERVKAELKRRNKSARWLALESKVNEGALSRLIRGEREPKTTSQPAPTATTAPTLERGSAPYFCR